MNTIEEFFTGLYNLFWALLSMSQALLAYITQPISELVPDLAFVPDRISVLINFLLNTTPLGNMSILSFMLSAGIVIYMGYQFIVWLLNLVT